MNEVIRDLGFVVKYSSNNKKEILCQPRLFPPSQTRCHRGVMKLGCRAQLTFWMTPAPAATWLQPHRKPQWELPGRSSQPTELREMINCCFKPLSFGVAYYTIDFWSNFLVSAAQIPTPQCRGSWALGMNKLPPCLSEMEPITVWHTT